MQLTEIAQALGWRLLTACGEGPEPRGCYCGDLLSWVMGRAKEDDVWLTVMGNVNAIAVATLADVSCIVLTEDAVLDADAKMRAEQKEVPVYSTALPAYETALRLGALLKA